MTTKSIQEIANLIANGQTSIGMELGSTRIKTVMIGPDNSPIAAGSHDWENALVDGVWSYSIEDIWKGVQSSYKSLVDEVNAKYGVAIKSTKSLGISGMMHGYLAFDKDDNLLVPFRTWRNNFTGQASAELTELFQYPIPQRWNIAHLYQAILNGEPHVKDVRFVTTLAGYVHWKLTGQKVLGGLDGAYLLGAQRGRELGHAQVMQCGGSHAAKVSSYLLDHFGHEEQASFDGGGALLVGFALVGLAGHIVAQAQLHGLDSGHRVRQGLDTAGVHRAHFFHDAKKAVELREHALAFSFGQLQPRQMGDARNVLGSQCHNRKKGCRLVLK